MHTWTLIDIEHINISPWAAPDHHHFLLLIPHLFSSSPSLSLPPLSPSIDATITAAPRHHYCHHRIHLLFHHFFSFTYPSIPRATTIASLSLLLEGGEYNHRVLCCHWAPYVQLLMKYLYNYCCKVNYIYLIWFFFFYLN